MDIRKMTREPLENELRWLALEIEMNRDMLESGLRSQAEYDEQAAYLARKVHAVTLELQMNP